MNQNVGLWLLHSIRAHALESGGRGFESARCWAFSASSSLPSFNFSSLCLHTFLLLWIVLTKVPQGCASLTVCCERNFKTVGVAELPRAKQAQILIKVLQLVVLERHQRHDGRALLHVDRVPVRQRFCRLDVPRDDRAQQVRRFPGTSPHGQKLD